MIVYENLEKIKLLKKSVIAIGNFDGLHLGHKKVLREASIKAKKNNLKFGVITFEPVPVMFFNNSIYNHRINSLNQKIQNLKKLNIDFLTIIKFNKKFSCMNYKNFIKKIIFLKHNSKYVFISKNFKFGKNREGDVQRLKKNENSFFYKTCVAKPFKVKKKILSSTIIRYEIRKGNIAKANKLLGREWCIEGKVIKGDQRGRKIGFPTCNIKINDYVLPKLGVYSVNICINNLKRKGIANIGYRPTFKGREILLEVNIFGFKSNLYGRKLKVSFIKFIRSEKKFNNVNDLKMQINKDIIKAKKLKNV
jgi:riboflavin kinase/FMN adenylyltransferase|tara:strand:- start:362 stop:1282 length:921 start_codon:yes stop_codon:yes gene_type:complete